MHNRPGRADLWREWIRLYFGVMARKIYNIPLLETTKAFWAFLDAYATSLDINPICGKPAIQKSPEALWEDFIRVTGDANAAFERHT